MGYKFSRCNHPGSSFIKKDFDIWSANQGKSFGNDFNDLFRHNVDWLNPSILTIYDQPQNSSRRSSHGYLQAKLMSLLVWKSQALRPNKTDGVLETNRNRFGNCWECIWQTHLHKLSSLYPFFRTDPGCFHWAKYISTGEIRWIAKPLILVCGSSARVGVEV